MKHILFLVLAMSLAVVNAGPAARSTGPAIKFKETQHNFGSFKQGESVEYTFVFTNTGDAPLVIENVERPCGCTDPSWTKEPVAPGKTGEVKIVYHSKDRPGAFRKTFTVTTNMNPQPKELLMLMIKGSADKTVKAKK
jgi:hypothetical protein